MSFDFMTAVTICGDLEPKKIKSVIVSIVSQSICHKVMGPDAMILVFPVTAHGGSMWRARLAQMTGGERRRGRVTDTTSSDTGKGSE